MTKTKLQRIVELFFIGGIETVEDFLRTSMERREAARQFREIADLLDPGTQRFYRYLDPETGEEVK